MSHDFPPDWLALREPYDRAARSRAMALKFFDALPEQSRLVDLGLAREVMRASCQWRRTSPLHGD